MADPIEDLIAKIDAFEPTSDSIDNDEKLQIWVDRWEEADEKEKALPNMFGVFERNPEITNLGEPGPLVHAIEQVPGYEQALVASLQRAPSYYATWIVNRILEMDLPDDVQKAYMDLLRNIADNAQAPWSVRATAKEFLEFHDS